MRISGELKSALDAIGEPILLVTCDARIAHRNRRATTLAGLSARTRLVEAGEGAADILDFLARCARSGRYLGGSLRLPSTPEAAAIELRCRGHRVRGTQGDTLVLLHLLADAEPRTARDRDRIVRLIERAEHRERARIARDLHDQAGQGVLSLKLGLERLRRTCIRTSETAAIDVLIGQVDLIVHDLRRAILDPTPPAIAELGLERSLRDLVARWSLASGIPIAFEVVGEPEALTAPAGTALFRLLQEALTNIAKHATGVSTASITLRHMPGRATLTIQDDGVGLPAGMTAPDAPARPGRFGLVGMQERIAHIGGTLELRGRNGRGRGTTITARIRTGS